MDRPGPRQSKKMAKGDHIKVRRLGLIYAHHGIDMGDGTVIHFAEAGKKAGQAKVTRAPIPDFLKGGIPRVVEYRPGRALSVEQTAQLALAELGAQGYSLSWNNCEHFATYCKTGRRESRQVKRALAGAAAAGLAVAVFVARAISRRG